MTVTLTVASEHLRMTVTLTVASEHLRIASRLHEQRQARQDDGPVMALVLRTDHENAAYIDQHFGELRKSRPRRTGYHAGAYERGQQRGADVSLIPRLRLKGGNAIE